MLDGKKILITGGTGSLGIALTKKLIESKAHSIRIYSRNESKQVEMQDQVSDPRLRFLIGDVRDLERLTKAMEDIDIVFHAAALKHVPIVEYNPFEAIKTNVLGSQNVIDACLKENVETAVCIGTDKAVSPLNTYGATKHLMEKLFVTASNYINPLRYKTKFLAVRYGNVLGSSNSVIPKFIEQIQSGKNLTITDPNMTRFTITMNQAVDLILTAIEKGHGGEVFVPKLKAYRLDILKDAILDILKTSVKIEKIPVRQGEKYHEALINSEELRNTFEIDSLYIILNKQMHRATFSKWNDLKITTLNHEYSSDKVEILAKEKLIDIIIKEGLLTRNE
ncbi:UDP-N-acetylglucosamine 46-dehydratase protein [Marine Group I thaumarchaeote SCGC AAA799-O18]|nr:UDP-N-acetylglucosamine 46-dehydratase protein [Marine Group I thaumarchaeote SCGC AAA799-O18]